MAEGRFANIYIEISHEKVDKPFQYLIPEGLKDSITVGSCVKIPFGKGNNLIEGYVVEITDKCDYPIEKVKEIASVSENRVSLETDAIKLAHWMKETYGSTMIAALKTALPVKSVIKPKEKKKIVRKMDRESILSLYAQCTRKKQYAKARLLKELSEEEILPYDLVIGKLHVGTATLNSLSKEGALGIEVENVYRNPVVMSTEQDKNIVLSDEQRTIIDTVVREYDEGINSDETAGRYLIHGITGAGKTEVYIRIIEQMIQRKKQCILLIPEIALTYQMLMRFYKKFGDRVSVINSTLSAGERYDQCQRAQKGEIDVIIGPRSALFVPFNDLGLVIVDEEHEPTYISEQNPRYHVRDTAMELCRIKKASLILGSATPSLEAYYMAQEGVFKLFKMTQRLTGGELPDVSIVDLCEELRSGNRSIFSRALQDKLSRRLENKEQSILFLNRRGYQGFVSCRACGHVMKCPHCDVSLTKHRGNMLMCHYCGYSTPDVNKCPECGSKYILGFKAGTQQVEEELLKLYPGIRVLRMDADTTKTKDSYERILTAFAEGEADVLLGTQMIVKGHDFPNVTLVGIIAADLSLNDADFRSGERTFQLLTQAVGRAGRGERAGEAVIQTYRPEHYSIVKAANQDYEAFYEEEMAYRILGDYPPAGGLLRILVQSKDDKRALGLATALAKRVKEGVRRIGPAPDAISKINDYYRYNLYLKSSDSDLLRKTRADMEDYLNDLVLLTETVTFEVK